MSEHIQCERRGKWIRGCRFGARHEYGRPDKVQFGWGVGVDEVERVLMATRPWTYVRDVCITCGRTIERAPSPAPTGEETT